MRLSRPPLPPQVSWLLLLGAASLGVAGWSHSVLGLSLRPQGALAWLMFLALGPLVEEWAFRANLLPELTRSLQRRWPRPAPWLANALVSLLFVGVHHGMAGSQAVWWFIPSWVLGMVWFKFRRLTVCVLVHAWFNVSLALVSWGGPLMAHAKSNHMPCSPDTTPAMSAHTVHADRHLQAEVHPSPTGQWVLLLIESPRASASAHTSAHRCLRNDQLLGSVTTDPLPTLSFDGGELQLQWFRPASSAHASSEMHLMVLDGAQAEWPVVRYAHEVSSLTRTRSVSANLRTHQAQWHQRDPASAEGNTVSGALLPMPLQAMASLPHHTAFALRPKVPRVHQGLTDQYR